jgi:DNA-binding NarL/FixJ family response regulator
LVRFGAASDEDDLDRYNLSPREKEVLKELVTTLGSNPEIAERLGVKVTTVKAHIHSICDKTGFHNRVELIDRFHWHWAKAEEDWSTPQ